jgi:twitching motility protein PilJ
METTFWSLIVKGAGLLAVVLLPATLAVDLLDRLGWSVPGGATLIILIAVPVAMFAIVGAAIDSARANRRQMEIAESAELLASGIPLSERDAETSPLSGISDYLRARSESIERLLAGDRRESAAPLSDSDVLGKSLHDLVVKYRESLASESSRDQLYDALVKLMDEVSGASTGDLTIHAEVGQEITGPLADAFNTMTDNLRRLIGQVKDITDQVANSAVSMRETTEQLAKGSLVQAAQISRTTSAVSKMAAQIQQVSKNAEISSAVASESLAKARNGTKAASDNINAMRGVRNQVQETSKRVKRLGERSQEIGQIVALVEDLSDRTSLLALNATLQAAAAGDAGAAFASVAEEVERLADRSNKLTRQIASLTDAINSETQEVVAAMENTIREVVVGSTLADKAGQALFGIESTSSRLADLLRSISESARYQASSSEDISNAMASISEVTEIVEGASRRASDSVRALVRLSDELQASVSPFKLPPAQPLNKEHFLN